MRYGGETLFGDYITRQACHIIFLVFVTLT